MLMPEYGENENENEASRSNSTNWFSFWNQV